MRSLLLIEDDVTLGTTLTERLQKEGFAVAWAKSQKEGEELCRATSIDLAIIDVGLPDGNGFELAKKIKAIKGVPFIFVTAMNSAEYRLAGYELGADEYIPKPFHLKELLLRIRKVLGATAKVEAVVKVNGIIIDLNAMNVTLADGSMQYPSARDFQILKLLIQAAPRVISREELVQEVCKNSSETPPTNRTIDNSIVRLRQLLDSGGTHVIRSIRGIGYQWLGG